MTHSLSCITWNIHRGRGSDRLVDPERILDVLSREVWHIGTDALILQEADAETDNQAGVVDPEKIERVTGLRHLQTARALRSTDTSHGFLGVVVYLHPDIVIERVQLVDLPGHCARGAVVADVKKAGIPVRLVATHLSLAQWLRVMQMRTLGQFLQRFDPRQTVVCGDLNEWRFWGGFAFGRAVTGLDLSGPALRSFPVRMPLLPLDRVLSTPEGHVSDAQVLDGTGIRAASDHRPLRASVTLGVATSAP
ncbi:endonuclease/exonuclease/phosphatase family protein [Sulfitobacter guttiformis]|uniref:Endonuclease/exonuclease/phosphatase family metal-dependent hydrolase n=1 Tax=Sulfitobacter guttiformis TaxID=74349 RepID=A0A420DTK8_9RHOB|nr:endonuclease/exonuclease/phosphatase family protein [Sulfitobacter guttiformis]KIN71093.1 putative endonuclease/exonuclease/phosphatase protein [Sulfitobacter guttiformis KCTC 32187]RKE97575.1 endonuclease/exonuclease/phosphatase family metal-dependent hydrolase [Sulfitobacter guttiformis]